jgi:hypothetical protein
MPLLIVVGVAALLYGLHRLALFAEARGWIFYKTRAPRVRTLGFLEELVNPSIEYMVEEQSSQEIRADHAESGDPKDPGVD